MSFSRGSSQFRDRTASPALAGRFFYTERPEKPLKINLVGISLVVQW